MPKKPKFTKEEVINAAYEIIKEEGLENLAARGLARKLNSACSPIFTLFSSMEEVKEEVYKKAKKDFVNELKKSLDYFPIFKEFGLRFVNYAVKNPKLFIMLFGPKYLINMEQFLIDFNDIIDPIIKGIEKTFGLNSEDSNYLFYQMITNANGMAIFMITGKKNYSEEEIGKYLSELCIGLVLIIKAKENKLDVQMAQNLAKSIDIMPVKIK